jgi:hypothetical protein
MLRSDTSTGDLRGWLTGTTRAVAPEHELLRTRLWRLQRRSRAVVTRRPGSDLR